MTANKTSWQKNGNENLKKEELQNIAYTLRPRIQKLCNNIV